MPRTLKSIKRLRDGSFLVECGKTYSEQTDWSTDQSESLFTRPWTPLGSNQMSGPCWHHGGWDPGWTGGSGCGWGEPSDTEGGEGDPHQHHFLFPKEITVGYLKVKVALFVPNPMRCFNCNKFGHTSQHCKVAAKCTGCGKDKHEGQCEGPKLCSICNGPHASSAKDCPVWQKEKEIQRVRVDKRITFPEARQLKLRCRLITGGRTYTAATSTRRESRSVQCQTSLTWAPCTTQACSFGQTEEGRAKSSLSNHFSALSDDEMDSSSISPDWKNGLFSGTCEDSKPTSRSSLCFREGISRLCLIAGNIFNHHRLVLVSYFILFPKW